MPNCPLLGRNWTWRVIPSNGQSYLAFEFYTRAKNLVLMTSFAKTGYEEGNLLQAADLLNQAIAQDPSFFEAYCPLAMTHDHLYFFGYDRTPARLL